MSNLLNAIAQSEQQNQYQPQLASRSAHQVAASRRLPSWLLPALLVIAPVAGTLAYSQFIEAQSAGVPNTMISSAPVGAEIVAIQSGTSTIKAEPAMPKSAPLVLGEGASEIRFLPYPELPTEPLPSLNRQFASQATRTAVSLPAPSRTPEPAGEPRVISAQPSETEWGLDGLDYSELSPLLAEQLKSAIAATDSLPVEERSDPPAVIETVIEAVALGELPASVQNRIPPLNFQTHIYSSVANSRWVKVNGREAFEGDEIAPGVTLRRIEPRQVVFDFEAYLVQMPALSEW